ncbi:hypothetical protein [Catellatospora methionotrophica]|uniref:hypothetical protein n=1 Tax=Catellatospora methionotrophica TaxID=121620 RepID=UPI0033D231EE
MREQILIGVAANRGAPVDVLLRLLSDEAQACWDTLCGERDLPPAVLDAVLAHPDRLVRRRIARNPHLDPAQRARLLDDPDPKIALAVVVQPVRWSTGTEPRPLPDDVVRRLLADPGPMLTVEELLYELASTQPGATAVEIAATHAQPEARAAACGFRRVLSDERWLALQRDPDPRVRAATAAAVTRDARLIEPADMPPYRGHYHWQVLQLGRLSRTLVDQLTAEGDPVDLKFMAYNRHLPPDVVELLVSHPDAGVRGTAAKRGDLSAEQLTRLSADVDEGVRITVSMHPALSESQRAAIAVSRWPRDSFDRLRQPPLPELAIGIARAYSVNPLLRREAARDPRLPHAVAARLAEDPDQGVRLRLALCHPSPPPPLLLRSYREAGERDRPHLATRPGFPVAGLVRFARDPDPMLRLLALLDPEVPADVVDGLLADPVDQVWQAAAAHPRLPADRLRELLTGDRAPYAAANPALDGEALHGLLDAAAIPRLPR